MNLINRDSVNRSIAKCTLFGPGTGFCVALLLFMLSASAFDINAQTQIQGTRDNPQVYSGVVYGPIDQNDTLWRIASRYKQDARFTVYQTMMAIFELNPQAFENGNFNTMVNGATLQLPSDRYIARVDPQQARAKADTDQRALGRTSSVGNSNNDTEAQSTEANLKPQVPLVNQDDLAQSATQLQSQLNVLKQQQQQQFEQLKNQVATSITSVEILLQENKKLNDQLVKIDENSRNLTQKVEIELQTQIDQQVEQLSQLIALVKDSEQRRIDQESQSIMQILSSPMALIIMMSSVTLLLIFGMGIFLLRKPATEVVLEESEIETASTDITDDDLVIGEADDNVDQDSEDLMAALSEQNDFEEDDILSDALEDDDSISMLSEDDMEAELEGLDDMLVPDSPSELADFDVSDDSLGESLDDEQGTSLDEDEPSISSDGDEPIVTLDEDEPSISLDDEPNLPNSDLDKDEANSAPENEVSITEQEDSDGTPVGINLDENGEIDQNTIDQISEQIEEKDQVISRLTDELLDELDNVPNNSAKAEELVNDEALNPSQDEEIALSEGDENSEDGVENEDLSDTELDDLLDSINDDPLDIDLTDDLSTVADEALVKQPNLGDLDESDLVTGDFADDQVSALADELLQELESEDSQADELDQLLDGIDIDEFGDEQAEGVTPGSIGASESANKEKNVQYLLDADDLLDDIPSFTSDLSDDEIEEETTSETETVIAEELVGEDKLDATEQLPDNKVSSLADLEDESDEDVLSVLPGLDNWLNEEDELQEKELAQSPEDDELDFSALNLDVDDIDVLSNSKSEEDDLIENLDNADFDDMLNELGDDNDPVSDSSASTSKKDDKKLQAEHNDPLGSVGLDLDALMTPTEIALDSNDSKVVESDDFVDVDDLLMESDTIAKLSDEDIELDLDSSLDKLMSNKIPENELPTDYSDTETNQSSNLDLAQVYIDMEDFMAAKELLEEVTRLGSQEQQDEAIALLAQIKS